MNNLLDAPCVFCGYNGSEYWQSGTHLRICPWWYFTGKSDRKTQLRNVLHNMFIKLKKAKEELEQELIGNE